MTITMTGITADLDESGGLQLNDIQFAENPFGTLFGTPIEVALSGYDADDDPDAFPTGQTVFTTDDGLAPTTFVLAADGNGTRFPTDPKTSFTPDATYVDSGLRTLDDEEIYLFATDDPLMVVGRTANGSVVLAVSLELVEDIDGGVTGGKLWTALYEPLAHAALDGGDPDGPLLTLANKIYVSATSETTFDAAGVPSGQNLFIMFKGVENPDLGIVVTGKTPANQSEGGNINSGDTVNTSQVTGTTFGVNNQMIDAQEGLWFTFVTTPDPDYTVPNLSQTEADVEANIQFGGSFSATSVEFDVVQLQGGKSAVVKITAIDSPDIGAGTTFVDELLSDNGETGLIVDIASVTVTLAGGGSVTFSDTGAGSGITATFNADGTVTLAGLKAGDSIEYTTDGDHDRVLIENGATGKGQASAAFDIGGFTITDTTDLSLEIGSKARFADDEPTATGTAVTFTVDEDGLSGGIAGGTNDVEGTAISWSGSVAGIFQSGADAPLTYGMVTTLPTMPTLTSGGETVKYDLTGNTLTAYVGTKSAETTVFTFSITNTATGAASFTLGPRPLDHADTDDGENVTDIVVNLGALVQATDADGDTVTAAADKVRVTIDDDSPTATGTAVTFTVDEDGLSGGIAGGTNDVEGAEISWSGSVAGIFQSGADAPLTYGMVATLPTMPTLKSGGEPVLYEITGNTLTAYVGTLSAATTVFTFSITDTATGAASFTLGPRPLDHADTDDGENVTDIVVNLGALVQATDADGDTVTAAADKVRVTIDDDSPTATGTPVTFTVDEDGLSGGIAGGTNDVDGAEISWSGSVAGIFQSGADAPLTYGMVTTLPTMPTLTSGGETVKYDLTGNTLTAYVGTKSAETTVFTFSITDTATGAASFTLGPRPLDHADTDDGENVTDIVVNLGALVQATDADGDTVTAAADKVRVTIDDDSPVLTVGNMVGSGTPDPQVGQWSGAFGADGAGGMTLTMNGYTIGGVPYTDGMPMILQGVLQPDGTYAFSGMIKDVPFTLTFDPANDSYVFDLDGSFESEATFNTANGSLPAGGPDPVQTLEIPSNEDPTRLESVVFFAVNPQAPSGEGDADGIADILGNDEAYLEGPDGPAFIGSTWLMNVSTSGIGVGNNVLQGDRTANFNGTDAGGFSSADESFVIDPASPVSQMRVYIDNSVGGYNASADAAITGREEALYYRVFYEDGSVSGWTLVTSDPAVLGTEGQNRYFDIDAGDQLIDAVQFMMDKGDIKIPYITFKVANATVAEPVSIDFTAALTDADGDTVTADFTVSLNADANPLTAPGIVLTGTPGEQDSFNIDLPMPIEPWVINGFDRDDGDLLVVSASDFGGGLATGVLGADYFVWGTAAADADDRFLYDTGTGELRFDADGNGAGEAVLVATLTDAPELTADDILVIA
jgi:T1SS-143 domain-containing protein